jgi:hypothetical protein
MKERMEALWQLQNLGESDAEVASAVPPQHEPMQETQDMFARMNVGVDYGGMAHQDSQFMPSTELRRNVTRRRSSERARDSVGSTSVPVQRLVSRKPKDRPNDMAYASETKAPKGRDAIDAVSVRSPDVTSRHKVLKAMWTHKKALEEDIDEALGQQSQDDFHRLVQQHKQVNQDMYDVLVGSPLTSTPALFATVDEESYVLWFDYAGEEISVIAWPQMTVKTLTERAVAILVDRGVIATFEQILLQHEGIMLDAKTRLQDYGIVSEDTIVLHVSRSHHSPDIHPGVDAGVKAVERPSHDIFANHPQSSAYDIFGETPRDLALPPRNIFGAAEASGLPKASGGLLFQGHGVSFPANATLQERHSDSVES